MLDTATRDGIVDEFLNAWTNHVAVKPLRPRLPALTITDAYAIQEEFLRRRLAAGRRIVGYKVGLTSKAMQDLAGSTEPDFSALPDDLLLYEGAQVPFEPLFAPMLEIEIAFVMKDRLKGPGVTVPDVIRATDFVLPSIELVDIRVERGPAMSLVDNIADLAYCGGVVLGGNPRRLDQIDVRTVSGTLIRNGVAEQTGLGSAVMGNPVTVVAWLANKLSEFGVTFEPGHTILTGSFLRAIPIRKGDEIVARFDQGLGDVATTFA